MINKNCGLTNKGKLYVVLHAECRYSTLFRSPICKGCSYFNTKEQEAKAKKLQEMRSELSCYGIELETRFETALSAEIKSQQEKGYIRKDIDIC